MISCLCVVDMSLFTSKKEQMGGMSLFRFLYSKERCSAHVGLGERHPAEKGRNPPFSPEGFSCLRQQKATVGVKHYSCAVTCALRRCAGCFLFVCLSIAVIIVGTAVSASQGRRHPLDRYACSGWRPGSAHPTTRLMARPGAPLRAPSEKILRRGRGFRG